MSACPTGFVEKQSLIKAVPLNEKYTVSTCGCAARRAACATYGNHVSVLPVTDARSDDFCIKGRFMYVDVLSNDRKSAYINDEYDVEKA